MAITLRQKLDSWRWIFKERGIQRIWDELDQVFRSKTNVASGAIIGSFDITTEGASGLVGTAGVFSGAFSSGNTGTGKQSTLPDLGTAGGYGPTPVRLSQNNPSGGFRNG
jgi:hypothetical protein